MRIVARVSGHSIYFTNGETHEFHFKTHDFKAVDLEDVYPDVVLPALPRWRRPWLHSSATVKMMLLLGMLIAMLLITSISTLAQGADVEATDRSQTAFAYQGSLSRSGEPADGSFDFQFTLFQEVSYTESDAEDGQDDELISQQVGDPLLYEDVAVSKGTFSVLLDFGPWQGEQRLLEIGVRTADGNGAFTILSPRQPIQPVPLALALSGFRTERIDGHPTLSAVISKTRWPRMRRPLFWVGGGAVDNPNRIEGPSSVIVGGVANQIGPVSSSVIVRRSRKPGTRSNLLCRRWP